MVRPSSLIAVAKSCSLSPPRTHILFSQTQHMTSHDDDFVLLHCPHPMKSMGLLLAVLMIASVMFFLSVILTDLPSDDVAETDDASRALHITFHQGKKI